MESSDIYMVNEIALEKLLKNMKIYKDSYVNLTTFRDIKVALFRQVLTFFATKTSHFEVGLIKCSTRDIGEVEESEYRNEIVLFERFVMDDIVCEVEGMFMLKSRTAKNKFTLLFVNTSATNDILSTIKSVVMQIKQFLLHNKLGVYVEQISGDKRGNITDDYVSQLTNKVHQCMKANTMVNARKEKMTSSVIIPPKEVFNVEMFERVKSIFKQHILSREISSGGEFLRETESYVYLYYSWDNVKTVVKDFVRLIKIYPRWGCFSYFFRLTNTGTINQSIGYEFTNQIISHMAFMLNKASRLQEKYRLEYINVIPLRISEDEFLFALFTYNKTDDFTKRIKTNLKSNIEEFCKMVSEDYNLYANERVREEFGESFYPPMDIFTNYEPQIGNPQNFILSLIDKYLQARNIDSVDRKRMSGVKYFDL